jgi:hypothetical protein
VLDARPQAPATPASTLEDAPRETTTDEGGRVLACAACGRPITTTAARIEMDGAHAHTFANPHGFVYRIGCFSTAPGCAPVSPPSTDFAWFAGYAWQIAACTGCGEHIGWLFRSGSARFHGLILDRLVEAEDRES